MTLKEIILGGMLFASSTSASLAYASPGAELVLLPPATAAYSSSSSSSQKAEKGPSKPWEEKPLEEKIDLYIKGLRQDRYLAQTDRTSIMVYDLAENETIVSINEDQPRMAASLIKPFVMVGVYDAVTQGKVKDTPALSRELTSMITYNRGCREANRATNRLLRAVGLQYVNQALQKYGFQQTRIREFIPGDGRTYRNVTSARDISTLLRRIYQGTIVNPQADREMLQLLKRSYHTRLRAESMWGIEIANKTGYVLGMNGDAGIVFRRGEGGEEELGTGKQGKDEQGKAKDEQGKARQENYRQGKERPYIITILIEDKTKPYARQRGASWGRRRTAVIREVSGMVWKGMGRGG